MLVSKREKKIYFSRNMCIYIIRILAARLENMHGRYYFVRAPLSTAPRLLETNKQTNSSKQLQRTMAFATLVY